MPAYLPLIDWTGQGARTVKGAPNRRGQAEALAEKHGVRFGQVYWTVGPQDDVVVVLEAEDDESATAIMVLELGARGRPQDDDASSLRPRGDVGDRIGRLG
jgi:uncharacterized protein with GYD domain